MARGGGFPAQTIVANEFEDLNGTNMHRSHARQKEASNPQIRDSKALKLNDNLFQLENSYLLILNGVDRFTAGEPEQVRAGQRERGGAPLCCLNTYIMSRHHVAWPGNLRILVALV